MEAVTTDRKRLLLYLLTVLAFMRFVAVPAAGTLDERKALYEDTLNVNKSKMRLLARQNEAALEDTPENVRRLMGRFYPESADKTAVGTDIADWLTKSCQSKGMTVSNFEFLEETKYPDYVEVPVTMRMTGQLKKIFELLMEINEREPMMAVKKFELEGQGDVYKLTLTVSGCVPGGLKTKNPPVPGGASK